MESFQAGLIRETFLLDGQGSRQAEWSRTGLLWRIAMEAFGISGFFFGLVGFSLAVNANAGIKKLKEELENLRKEVQALKEA